MTARTNAAAAVRAVFGSSAAAVSRLERADRSLRAALPVSRRVAFVSAAGGVGCTSAVASVGSLLAHRRRGTVLAVDAGGGHAGLGTQLARPPARGTAAATRGSEPDTPALPVSPDGPDGTDETERADEAGRRAELLRRSARTGAEARAGLDRTASGLYLLDLAGPDRRPDPGSGWVDRVGPIARFFDLVLTDWGRRSPSESARIAAESHLVVVVGRADPWSAAQAAGVARTLQHPTSPDTTGPDPTRPDPGDERRPGTLLLLVDVTRSGAATAAGLRAALGLPVVVLPYEPVRSRVDAPTSRDFAARTRNAHLELAAALVDAAVADSVPARRAARPVRRGDRPGRVVAS